LALARSDTNWRAIDVKLLISLAFAQRFSFAALRAFRSVMLDRYGVVMLECRNVDVFRYSAGLPAYWRAFRAFDKQTKRT